jgi:2-hydroxychromene-2-carboxylate isomerase
VSITFFFDPICPFTWRTSRWVRDVAGRRGLDVSWRILSLEILNEDKDIPAEYRPRIAWSTGAQRVLLAADAAHGQDAMANLYTAIGERVHDSGAELSAELLAQAVAAAGLPASLADAADDDQWDKQIRASHEAAQARVGTETGSPVVAIGDGPGFFGPVVVPIPTGEDADRLFDAVSLLATVPQFSELKRARNQF